MQTRVADPSDLGRTKGVVTPQADWALSSELLHENSVPEFARVVLRTIAVSPMIASMRQRGLIPRDGKTR